MHIVDSVLVVPKNLVEQSTEPQFKFLTSILSTEKYISTESDFSNQVLLMSDITGFAPATQGALDTFLELPAKRSLADLKNILEYHIVEGQSTFSSGLINKTQMTTLQGKNLTIYVDPNDGVKYVNGIKIIATDYPIFNGVLHIIDGLLDPNNITTPTFSSPTTPPAPTPSTPASVPKGGLSIAAKVGITLAIVILVGVIVAAALLILCGWKKSQKQAPQPEQHDYLVARYEYDGWNDPEHQSSHRPSELDAGVMAYASELPANNERLMAERIVNVAEYQEPANFAIELEAPRGRAPMLETLQMLRTRQDFRGRLHRYQGLE
jgi:uncharacterized surface protein with fasciclin (FAS1) repeats